jgi:hypothetical protein
MSTLSELIDEGRRRQVKVTNRAGKTLFTIPLLWAVVVAIAAPQLLLVTLLAVLLEMIDVEVDDRSLGLKKVD